MPSETKLPSLESLSSGLTIDTFLRQACAEARLAGYILCAITDPMKAEVLSASPMPIEPLRGSENVHVLNVVLDCFKHPVAHCHAIGHLALPNIIKRMRNDLIGLNRTWFIPFSRGSSNYVFLGFPLQNNAEKKVPAVFTGQMAAFLLAYFDRDEVTLLRNKLSVTERYVKEVGHDIASSVQASLAKLRNISQGLIPTEFVGVKAREAELEILSAYRVADGLGLTLDQNYQVKEFVDFDLIDCISAAIALHKSEAEERHLITKLVTKFHEIGVIGDKAAFEQAMGHLLSNAVKYSKGNTSIEIHVDRDSEYASISVKNLGIALPKGNDEKKIWDFGFRGEEAYGRHVNGSGIGLYTVKKIVLAHHGQVSCGHNPNSILTWFEVRVPLASYLSRHRPGLIVDAIANRRR